MKKKLVLDKKFFNVKKSIHDKRNFKHKDVCLMSTSLPGKFSLRDFVVSVDDQKSLGVCYAFGGCGLIEDRRKYLGLPDYNLSKMFLSYMVRLVEADVNNDVSELYSDNGASLLNTAKAMKKYGTVLDSLYPYNDSVDYFKNQPCFSNCKSLNDDDCFNVMLIMAKLNSVKKYVFLDSISEIKDAISKGYEVAIGIDVYNNFWTLEKGRIYNGGLDGESLLGGHFIRLIGFDDSTGSFEFVNSWGTGFCDSGFGLISYDFIRDMINDYDAFRISLSSEDDETDSSKFFVKSYNKITSIFRNY